jgi:hypothetical protein
MQLKQISIGFKDFWPGFNPQDFFVPFVSASLGCEIVVTKITKADVVFTSVFRKKTLTRRIIRRLSVELGISKLSSKRIPRRSQKLIWFTGENQRPPVNGFDLTYSFDADSFEGSNVYFPLVYLCLDWFQNGQLQMGLEGKRSGIVVTPEVSATSRVSDVAERSGFVCAFIGNPEPHRLRAVAALKSIGEVDVFGSAVGRPVSNKFEIAKDYKFMLCFENDLYPGYVTEKALEAWVCGCIPLWSGIDHTGILNPKSLLNSYDFDSLETFADEVARLNRDSRRLTEMGSEPIFTSQLTLDIAMKALKKVVHSEK